MDLFKRIQDLSAIYDDDGPSSTVLESRPMFADGQLVQPNADGSRPGYSGDKVYSDNYRTIYDKKTKLYSKKVGRDKKLLTQNPDETKKQFFNRVSNYSAEKSAERTGKFTKEIVDARSKIDSWTSNWLNNNLENYGVKDFDKMTKDMKEDWRVQSKKLKLPTDKIQITTKTGFPNLSTSKGKESAVSKNPFSYNNVTFYTPENPSGMDKYKAQWKKIFYKNKIQTTPGLKANINKYFDFINLDKRGAAGGQTIESFKNILDKDVLFLLSEKDSGLQKGSKFEVFNSFDELAKPYNEFTAKINRSETWKENANLIEKELGLKKNFIKNSMVKEQKAAAKFFGLDDLKGTGLEYSVEHGQGLSAAARSGNKELMRTAVNDLIGTTRLQNTSAGFGGFEATRGALIRDIEAGVNVKDNIASLNKLTKDAYKDLGVKSNIYSIKDGKLVSKPITTATTQSDRFKQYAETIYKDPLGKTAIDKKFGNLENVVKKATTIKQQIKLFKKMGYRCNKSGGGAEDVACYLDDVKQTRADLKSSDINVRAKAITKQRNALNVAKKLPEIGKVLRRVGQGTLAGVTGTLKVLGFTSPIGYAIEGAVEGGIYDYYRKKGYNHEQSLAETFTPGIVSGRPEGVPWYGGAEKLLEKELSEVREKPTILEDGTIVPGKVIEGKVSDPKILQYQQALKDQEQFYDAFDRKQLGLQKQRSDITDTASADIQDLYRSGTVSNINRIMNPESMASQAYNTAVERQLGLQDQRARDYKAENYAQTEPSEFMQEQKLKDRNKAMLEMFPTYTPEIIDSMYERANIEKPENLDYADFAKQMSDYDKSSYFADNFRTEKAGGGIAKEAGDRSGAMTRSMNPDSQGLSYLFNRVKKV